MGRQISRSTEWLLGSDIVGRPRSRRAWGWRALLNIAGRGKEWWPAAEFWEFAPWRSGLIVAADAIDAATRVALFLSPEWIDEHLDNVPGDDPRDLAPSPYDGDPDVAAICDALILVGRPRGYRKAYKIVFDISWPEFQPQRPLAIRRWKAKRDSWRFPMFPSDDAIVSLQQIISRRREPATLLTPTEAGYGR